MVVVADTGPIHCLFLIGQIKVLPALYQQVIIGPAVARELSHPHTPGALRQWFETNPVWLRTLPVAHRERRWENLDAGEREALSIATDLPAGLLLTDDSAARLEAEEVPQLRVTGTLGILYQAALERHLGNVPGRGFDEAVSRLRSTNFFFTQKLDDALRSLSRRLHQAELN